MQKTIPDLIRKVRLEGMQFITLTTGHICLSSQSHVPRSVIKMLLPTIEAGKLGNPVPMPTEEQTHYLRMSFTPTGMRATVFMGTHDAPEQGVPLVTFAASICPEADGPLYQELAKGDSVLPHFRLSNPTKPWLAVRLEPGIIRGTLQILMMLGDFERCMAWTFIEYLERTHERDAA